MSMPQSKVCPGRDERGQVVPLMAVLLVFAAVLGFGLVRVGVGAARRASAQAAADGAALAGAAAGPEAAAEVASANGAIVVGFTQDDLDVVVTVSRSGVKATARARWQPDPADEVDPAPEPEPASLWGRDPHHG